MFDTSPANLGVPGSETFNNLTFSAVNQTKTITNGGTLIVLGTLTLADGSISAGTIEAQADVIHQSSFDGGNTTIRIVQPTTRTITLAAGGKFPNLTLNAPNVTINTTGAGTISLANFNLQAGYVEQGSVAFSFASLTSFTQSGGAYMCGSGSLTGLFRFTLSGGSFSHSSALLRVDDLFTVSNGTFSGGSGDIDINQSFTLSGGTFTSTTGRLFLGNNFTHTAGGSFLHNNGTVIFDNFSFTTIDVSGSETFNNVTFNVSKNIAAGDTLITLGTLTLADGSVGGGTLSPRGNMTVASTFDGGGARVTFSGAEAQTYTNNGGANPTGTWTVNKSAGKVTLASNLTLATSQALNITSGTLDLGPSFNLTAGAIAISAGGILRNFGNGNLTLGGNLVNNGIFNFNGGGTGCGDANAGDPLLIRSSQSGTARNWSGTGAFSVVDVDVKDQNASAVSGGITAFTGTNSGNNTNWIFDAGCPIQIIAQPTDRGGCPDAPTSFTVGATGDSLTFRWRKNAVDLVDGGNISGATTATLTINPTTAGDVGSYDVVAINRFGVTATSSAANLTLLASPVIISQPVSAISCETQSVTFTVGATGDGLTYQWRKDGNPISGANGSSFSIPSVAAIDAGNYDVVVGGTCSPPVISSVATLDVNTAPVITSQPANQEVPEGSSASFSVTATGTDLTFQWRRNGMPLSDGGKISGANNATLTIDSVATEDAGTYDVVVGGTCSPPAISDSVSLTVNVCSSAGLVTFECIPSVTAMSYFNDTPVPLNARLSTQLQMSHGVSFGSIAGYVAVVNLGSGRATSPSNGIGGVDASNRLNYDSPVVITFSMPGSSSSTPAITDFVSIRGDQIPADGSAKMEAFDISGALIGSVTVPDVSGGLTLSLSIPNIHSVRLTQKESDIAYDDLRFNPLAPGLSARPTANAGPDQPIHVGQTVALDGSGSSDDNTATENLVFAWTLVTRPDGSAATLAGADSMSPSFVADMPGEYGASLTVTDADGLSSDRDTVAVSSLNAAPVANAGVDRGVFVGQAFTLDGSASYDPDSDPLEFSWTLTAPDGSASALSGETTAFPTFTPDIPGSYTATLTVNDPFGGVSADSVVVSVISAQQFAANQIASALNIIGALTSQQVTTRGNRQALQNYLTQALAALQAGDLVEARSKLMQAIERTDGCILRGSPDGNGSGRDWVIDCAVQATLHDLLTSALDALT
ncbi:MAG: immunoglobulin domain-containing protein [Acidobacteria bacterium]|nr:immunoglobulin domain-containing protein [Acidobacteriota bacterium]